MTPGDARCQRSKGCQQGEDVIIVPAVTDEEARGKVPKGWKALKPYLWPTPPPDR